MLVAHLRGRQRPRQSSSVRRPERDLKAMEEYEAFEGLNESALTTEESSDLNTSHCGHLDVEKYSTIQSCTFWVEGIAMSILGFGAIITNFISIYVFSKKEMRNSFNTLIVVLTVVDSLLCIFLMTDFTFARAFQLHTVIYTLMYPWFIYPLTNTMLSASILMTVVLALERYIAVCHPLFHRDLVHTHSITKRVTFYTVPVVIVSFLINIPKFFETETVTRETQNEDGNMTTYTIDVTELRDNPIYIKYYMNFTRTFLLGVIPFIALLYFNIRIYQRFRLTRRRYNRKKNNNSSQQAKDLQLGLILILVVCMFFVANLPRLLLNLYELFYVNEMIDCKEAFVPPTWFICSTSVNHLLLVLNCVMNFVIYCCCNESFRNILFFKPLPVVTNRPSSSRRAVLNGDQIEEKIEGQNGNIPMEDLNANGTIHSAEKKSMIQHSYSNPDEIMAIVDEVNFVKTKGTREHMSSSV